MCSPQTDQYLCHLLFIIYMNVLALEIEQSELDIYADDSTLGAADGTLDVIEQRLKPDICKIVNWCDDNRMAINYDKTKAILITTCQKLHTLPVKELNITVKRKILENVKQEKLLGLIVDQNLSWNSHMTKVRKTVSMLLARFRRIKPFLPTDAELNSAMPLFSPILTIAVQSGVPPIWTDFLSYKKEQHK